MKKIDTQDVIQENLFFICFISIPIQFVQENQIEIQRFLR